MVGRKQGRASPTEHLLSDQGTNLLSHLMLMCAVAWCQAAEYYSLSPQVWWNAKRSTSMFKAKPETRADQFGTQLDKCLSAILWVYRTILNESTREKQSFLLLGIVLIPQVILQVTTVWTPGASTQEYCHSGSRTKFGSWPWKWQQTVAPAPGVMTRMTRRNSCSGWPPLHEGRGDVTGCDVLGS